MADYSIKSVGGTEGFLEPDTSRGGKIYMLIYPDGLGSIVYVGQTIRSMKDRFYGGIKRQGYKWSKKNCSYVLFVWDVNDFTGEESWGLDSIESELTLASRLNQGCWPLHQTAIKFRWFRQSETAGNAPYIVMEMINDLYDFLKDRHDNKNLVEGQRKRIIDLLKEVAI